MWVQKWENTERTSIVDALSIRRLERHASLESFAIGFHYSDTVSGMIDESVINCPIRRLETKDTQSSALRTFFLEYKR
jgi:hypothetical protein